MIAGFGEFLDTPEGLVFWLLLEVLLWGSVLAAVVWFGLRRGK